MSDEQELVEPGTGNEGGLTDEQLLQFDREQADQQLNPEQLERYNELKEDKLKGAIEDKKTEDSIDASEGLAALREAAEDDLTVSVHGIEFLADVNPDQLNRLVEVAKFEDRKVDSLTKEETDKIHGNMLETLAELSVNHELSDWRENFGDAGLVTLGQITGDLLDKIEEFMSEKKSR